MRIILLFSLAFIFVACANVTVRPNGGARTTSAPDSSQSVDYFLWGLTPESTEVEVSRYCGGQEPSQIQAQTTFIDGLLGAITLGIYAPRSYRIWCS